MKKGFTLVAVLVCGIAISSIAAMIFSTVNTDLAITRNVRLSREALLIAQNGLNLFQARGLHYEDIERMSSGQKSFLLERVLLSSREKCEVYVTLHENEMFSVQSVGLVTKGDKVLGSGKIQATFKSFWKPQEIE